METKASEILVSICCLTYNHERYIRTALDGFFSQKTTFQYEILIHDDASTDRTQEIIREYEARYPGVIRPIYQTENQYSKGITNVSGAFNFPRAQGKYIAMCEGDDYWTDPDKLQKQIDYMEQHPQCMLCFHSSKIQVVDGSFTDHLMRPYRTSRIVNSKEIIEKPSGYPMASMLFRSKLVKNLPDYYKKCPVGDIPLELMAAARGCGYYIDEPMSVYRVGGSSSVTTMGKQGEYKRKQEQYFEQMRHTYRLFDTATGGIFHQAVKDAVKRIYFLTRVNTKRYDTVLKKEYQKYFMELSPRTRFFILVEARLPVVYRMMYQTAKVMKKKRKEDTH